MDLLSCNVAQTCQHTSTLLQTKAPDHRHGLRTYIDEPHVVLNNWKDEPVQQKRVARQSQQGIRKHRARWNVAKYSTSIGEFCDLCLARHTMRAELSRVLPLLWLNPRPVHLM